MCLIKKIVAQNLCTCKHTYTFQYLSFIHFILHVLVTQFNITHPALVECIVQQPMLNNYDYFTHLNKVCSDVFTGGILS